MIEDLNLREGDLSRDAGDSPSCGDARYFWENAGEQVYRFSFVATGGDWREAGLIRIADRILRPPVSQWIESNGGGDLSPSMSFLRVESETALLSSLAPKATGDGFFVRVFESAGVTSPVTIAGTLVESPGIDAGQVDLLDRRQEAPFKNDGTWQFAVAPWRIQTIMFDSM